MVVLKSLLHPDNADTILDEFVGRLESESSSNVRDDAIAYAQLYHPNATTVPKIMARKPAFCETEPSTNDADRLKKYLARFGLSFEVCRGGVLNLEGGASS